MFARWYGSSSWSFGLSVCEMGILWVKCLRDGVDLAASPLDEMLARRAVGGAGSSS